MEIELNEQNFTEEVLNSSIPVLVDFWAPWCMPCRIIAPLIEEISKEYAEKIKVGKLNVDENPVIANQYQIMGIPTLIIFKDSKPVDKIVGAVPKSVIEEKLAEYL